MNTDFLKIRHRWMRRRVVERLARKLGLSVSRAKRLAHHVP